MRYCCRSFGSVDKIPFLSCPNVVGNSSIFPNAVQVAVDPAYYCYQVCCVVVSTALF